MQLKKVRDVRRDRGLSQRELGERIGVNQPRISSIEWGTNVGRDTAERLAKALLCNVNDLTRPEEPTITLKVSDLPPNVLEMLTK
jgi:transcriptional regulator with XRE-family HTH domain